MLQASAWLLALSGEGVIAPWTSTWGIRRDKKVKGSQWQPAGEDRNQITVGRAVLGHGQEKALGRESGLSSISRIEKKGTLMC